MFFCMHSLRSLESVESWIFRKARQLPRRISDLYRLSSETGNSLERQYRATVLLFDILCCTVGTAKKWVIAELVVLEDLST